MGANHHILVPTDFSPHAEHAVAYAIEFARVTGSMVHFVHVLDVGLHDFPESGVSRSELLPGLVRQIEVRLDARVESAQALGVEADARLVQGSVVAELSKLALDLHCGLIVIATHGFSGFEKFVFGSTCEKLMRLSPVPLLIVKSQEHASGPEAEKLLRFNRVLCPCDFSQFSKAAIAPALRLCRDFGGTLVLAHVIQPQLEHLEFVPEMAMSNTRTLIEDARDSLSGLARRIQDVPVETYVLNGTPHRELSRLIEDKDIDIVVMTTHGRSGVSHLLFGSVAEKLVRKAACPVLVVRPQHTDGNEVAELQSDATACLGAAEKA